MTSSTTTAIMPGAAGLSPRGLGLRPATSRNSRSRVPTLETPYSPAQHPNTQAASPFRTNRNTRTEQRQCAGDRGGSSSCRGGRWRVGERGASPSRSAPGPRPAGCARSARRAWACQPRRGRRPAHERLGRGGDRLSLARSFRDHVDLAVRPIHILGAHAKEFGGASAAGDEELQQGAVAVAAHRVEQLVEVGNCVAGDDQLERRDVEATYVQSVGMEFGSEKRRYSR